MGRTGHGLSFSCLLSLGPDFTDGCATGGAKALVGSPGSHFREVCFKAYCPSAKEQVGWPRDLGLCGGKFSLAVAEARF